MLQRFWLPPLLLTILLTSACHSSRKMASSKAAKKDKPMIEHEFLEPGSTKENRETGNKEEAALSASLQQFIDDWYGTPHVMGGNTQQGVDCSGFVIQCYRQVYGENFLGRRAEDLFAEVEPLKKEELQEGDLVFFKIHGRRIDHVGLYLSEGQFVHVSSSRGVMVSNLSEAYFRERFFRGGRKRMSHRENQ